MKDKFFPAPFTQAEARNSVLFFLHFLLCLTVTFNVSQKKPKSLNSASSAVFQGTSDPSAMPK